MRGFPAEWKHPHCTIEPFVGTLSDQRLGGNVVRRGGCRLLLLTALTADRCSTGIFVPDIAASNGYQTCGRFSMSEGQTV